MKKDRLGASNLSEILAVDASSVNLHGRLYQSGYWRRSQHVKVIRAKLHAVFNIDRELINDFRVTCETINDLLVLRQLPLLRGKTYVFDRAYSDLKLWLMIKRSGSDFVSRLKTTSRSQAQQLASLTGKDDALGVIYEGPWTPSESACRRNKESPKTIFFRQILYRCPETKKNLHFITSDLHRPAEEIAEIYKKRWSIELLFRWLKQHLKVRTISAQNSNGVRSEIAVAILTHLLMVLKKLNLQDHRPLLEIYRELRTTFFGEALIEQGLEDDYCFKPLSDKDSTA